MAVNVELLKKVRKLIVEEPRRLWMPGWGYVTKEPDEHELSCGTVACLAGWINLAPLPESEWHTLFEFDGFKEHIDGEHIADRAARLIGLEIDECPFYKYAWGAPEVLSWIDSQIQKEEVSNATSESQ